MSFRSEDAPPASVVVAVSTGDAAALADTIAAIRRQVYEPSRIAVVGGDRTVRRSADEAGVSWAASSASLLSGLESAATHIWFVRAGARPRPDALQALVRESARTDASIAGSKLVRFDDPDRLIAVGIATDVFDASYFGLDADELDQGQYDVVRDVAAVPAASMLIRRDLALGIGGLDPLLAPEAAAIDLCQRARLRGARVVVVPSSEVLYPEEDLRAVRWREEAGRIRAMLKVYGPLTLAWALPLLFLIGLVEAVVSPFLGRWSLFSWIRSWGWNLYRLPSTLRVRTVARRGRVGDDAELFRYQMRGSARLKAIGSEIAASLRSRLPADEDYSGIAALGRDLRQPAFVSGAVALFFIGLATREVWRNALPVAGYSLPLPDSGIDAVRAYAGGWNPAGLGGVDPLRPVVGYAGILQTILFGKPGLTMAVLVVGALLAGVWGTTRLLRTWKIDVVPGIVAGAVLMTGPAARALSGSGELTTLIGLGLLPWALRIAVARPPDTAGARIGRVAAAAWVTGLMAAFSPLLLLIPPGVLLVNALLRLVDRPAWKALGISTLASGLGALMLLPWLTTADLHRFLAQGDAFWDPGSITPVIFGVVLVAALVAAPGRLGTVVAWGGLLVAVGALAARSGDLGPGRDVQMASLALVSLGTAAVVGAAIEAATRADDLIGIRRGVAAAGALAAAVLAATSFLAVVPGRAGLPADELRSALGFTRVGDVDATESRALLIGPPESLPGDSRTIRGASYKVVSTPMPGLWEAHLGEPRIGDDALGDVLGSLIDGETSRAGDALAAFGIRWIVVMGDTPLQSVFAGQLDLAPLGGLERTTFASEAPAPVRAVTTTGEVWVRTTWGYAGEPEPGARVRLADNANGRWGPGEWTQAGWANEVAADAGEARFRRIGVRSAQAGFSFAFFGGAVVLSWWGRRRR